MARVVQEASDFTKLVPCCERGLWLGHIADTDEHKVGLVGPLYSTWLPRDVQAIPWEQPLMNADWQWCLQPSTTVSPDDVAGDIADGAFVDRRLHLLLHKSVLRMLKEHLQNHR